MSEILELVIATPTTLFFPALGLIILVWGFAPGVVVRLASLGFRRDDPRRKEMIAELYVVARWEQPIWAAQQLERSLTEGLFGRLAVWSRGRLWDRWTLTDGVAMNAEWPDTFEIPEQRHKDNVRVGDIVKLGFNSEHEGGERMWVQVTKVKGDRYWGNLDNEPVVIWGLQPGSTVRFRGKHIIALYEDEQFERATEGDSRAP
ncbi:hypothetical protein [Agromyces seonyuensis]|uniref:DUF2314 domain-containing protein n=1 Tax=Agromyces seonyuensis TaxID=2662446 RepID=A0A6I4P2Q7_9MICO|nr:hypothetical protein [Agromyces seonyuensis]MWB99035.1 hypothetical protein [Agromyces seonyuensis]